MSLPPHHAAGRALCLSAIVACAGSGSSAPAPSRSPYEPPAAAAQPAAEPAGLTRIRFARGTSSGILNDSLPADSEKSYLLGADSGQVMLAHAIAWSDPKHPGAGGDATVRVGLAGGDALPATREEGPLWSGRLPRTGDYIVTVRSAGSPTSYTLAVQIPRRFDLGPEDPTASLAGQAPSRAPVDYVVAATEGQVLGAEVEGGTAETQLHVYGLDDGVQLSPLSLRRRTYRGAVPATQDYIVSVVPAAEGERYELTVELR